LSLAGLLYDRALVRSLLLEVTSFASLSLGLELVFALLLVANSLQYTRTLKLLLGLLALGVHDTVELLIGQSVSSLLLDTLLKLFDVLEVISLFLMLGAHLMVSQGLVEFLVFSTSLLFLKSLDF
jgi:hypothetical protein